MPTGGRQQQGKQAQAASTSSPKEGTAYVNLRDSYVPLFGGQPADHKEWQQRIHLYHRKMTIAKRGNESVLTRGRSLANGPLKSWTKAGE